MSDTDFYNRNLYRNYPLVDRAPYVLHADTPQKAVVDFSVVFMHNSGFDPSNVDHKIYLRTAGSLAISFRVVASGTNVDGIDLGYGGLSITKYEMQPFSYSNNGELLAFGYVVFGDTSDLPLFPNNVSYVSTTPFVEPRCIQVQKGHYVNKFTLANEARTTAIDRCTVDNNSSSSSTDYAYIIAPGGEAIAGAVNFKEGYNTRVVVLPTINTIRFSARRGEGAGEACEEVPRTWEELHAFEAGQTLDKAVRCNEVFNNINGIPPDISGNFTLRGGKGVEITNPSANTIRISGRDSMEEC